jgi:hypothetical protein
MAAIVQGWIARLSTGGRGIDTPGRANFSVKLVQEERQSWALEDRGRSTAWRPISRL